MHNALRLCAMLVIVVAAALSTAAAASAEGAFVGQGCFLGPPEAPVEGHGGIVIAPNGTAVSHCVAPRSNAEGEPEECFLYTAGQGEIVVFLVTPNGTVILVCSNARSG
jgi:hypothetical protein